MVTPEQALSVRHRRLLPRRRRTLLNHRVCGEQRARERAGLFTRSYELQQEEAEEVSIPFFLLLPLVCLERNEEEALIWDRNRERGCLDCAFWCGGREESIRDYLRRASLSIHPSLPLTVLR